MSHLFVGYIFWAFWMLFFGSFATKMKQFADGGCEILKKLIFYGSFGKKKTNKPSENYYYFQKSIWKPYYVQKQNIEIITNLLIWKKKKLISICLLQLNKNIPSTFYKLFFYGFCNVFFQLKLQENSNEKLNRNPIYLKHIYLYLFAISKNVLNIKWIVGTILELDETSWTYLL